MLDTVKNKIQRNALISLLTFIVSGTKSPAGYAFVPKAEAEKLQKADPSFVSLDPTVTNAEGQIKVTATQAAIDALNGQQEAPAAAASSAPEPMNFEIVTLDKLPPIMRGGNKSESYPFDKLNAYPTPGHAFFVPVTAARPNPAKSLASTVASATKRYGKGSDKRVFTVRKHTGADGKLLGAYVIRTS